MEMVQLPEGIPSFMHINQNEFSGRRHIKLKEEDIAICECKYDANDSDSSCGERCLNFLTSTECTPGYCPCSEYCKNQKFQKCEYAKMKLFKTEGRGWGLLADENIKAGHFIIEYCGEVISSEEAKQRSQTYEKQGLKDAYIISLNANYFIDATKKGSLARFINHSCQPNCETRKWTVLGETRVGIFAKQDIYIGTELAYDYNFEWYGGATVRCLCGAANCSLFLGAKSQGFQAYNHVWEDGDDRYTIDKIPLYDSAEDEPSSKLTKATSLLRPESSFGRNIGYIGITDSSLGFEHQFGPSAFSDERLYSLPVEVVGVSAVKSEINEDVKPLSENTQQPFPQMNVMMSHSQSNSAFPNYNTEPTRISKKKAKHIPNKGVKHTSGKQVNEERVAQLFASKEAQEEITKYKEIKNRATSELNLLYDEIRPAIEEHERDSQDSVPTSVAEKWIGATCAKLRADFNFHFSIVKNVVCPSAPSQQATDEAKPAGDSGNELKYLTN